MHSAEVFKKEGIDCLKIQFKRFANIRYEIQGNSVEIELVDEEIDIQRIQMIQGRFYENYKREFTDCLPNNPIEMSVSCYYYSLYSKSPKKPL